ncbi:MAG TPA: PE-PGRS family protein, partial [Pseudonocardiaceae bacterium]|nr:PE-PGRS family protein [Pseudonocardiaceae bacterium]
MQTWAKRGLQTALVTGGLLMLGTGIASANENVNPDRPASPIDGGVSVPVHVDDNAVGTPLGVVRPAGVNRTVGTDGLAGGPRRISTPAAGVPPLSTVGGHGVGGNRGRADVVVPVDVSGNAIAAGGDAAVVNHSDQTAGHTGPVLAGWDPNSASGNVVEVHHAAPVQVTGNAVG